MAREHKKEVKRKAVRSQVKKQEVETKGKNKVFELSFELGMTLSDAVKSFDRDRGKKFLGWGIEEKIDEVHGRYAPAACFELSREDEVKSGISKTIKTISSSNSVYVNLHTNELYYVSGGLGKEEKVECSDLLNRIMHIPIKAAEILAYLMKKEEISFDELNEKFELFYEENNANLRIILEEGLAALTPNRKGVIHNLIIPSFKSPRYDLRKYTSVVKSASSEYEVDPVLFHQEDVLKVLELIFSSKGRFKEVVYMPYYTCKYSDSKGMTRLKAIQAPRHLTR
jgi:hypothetical protein